MKFKVGDKVKLLNEIGEGEITRIGDNDIVHVQLEDGFDVPMKSNEIIRVSGTDNFPGQEKKEEREEAGQQEEIIPSDDIEFSNVDLLDEKNTKIKLVFGLVPNRINHLSISDLDLYLINDSNYGIFYHVGKLNDRKEVSKISTGILEDNTKIYLQTFTQSDLSKTKTIFLQAVAFGNQYYGYKEPINIKFDVSFYDFYRTKSYKDSEFFDTKAIILDVDKPNENDIKKEIEKLKDSNYVKIVKQKGDSLPNDEEKAQKEKQNPGIEEVDLHIEKIIDNHESLSNGEIVEIQLGRFETSLEGAIRSNQDKIVFIHGVGNGKLKHELRKKLERKYSNLKYQDASFKEYGYGATMVYLR